jgi:transmembrane sensor
MTSTVELAISKETIEAAATWYVDLQNTPTDELRAAHQHWLADVTEHRQAWQRVEKIQQTFSAAPKAHTHSTLINARMSRREAIKNLAILLSVSAVGTGAWQQKNRIRGLVATHKTATGERVEKSLADGTILHLNTASAVDVNYTNSVRHVHLHQGEIQITTAKDAQQRPFIVYTPQGSIRALGTQFLVRIENDKTQVSVFEQAVEIRTSNSPKQALRLAAQQKTTFSADNLQGIGTLNSNDNAWVNGLLIVNDWRLDQLVDELSRYQQGRLSCHDAVSALRISGAFYIDDITKVLENIAAILPIDVRYFTPYWVRIGKA